MTSPDPAPAAPTRRTWTPEERAKVRGLIDWKEPDPRLAFLTTDEDRAEVASCYEERMIAAFPGGPDDMERDNWKAAVPVSGKVGRECGSEFAERVLQMDTWTPSFRGVYVFTCVRVLGEAMRKRCECVADQAPKHYGSPSAFVPRMKAALDSNPPADQTKIRRILRSCADDSPTQ